MKLTKPLNVVRPAIREAIRSAIRPAFAGVDIDIGEALFISPSGYLISGGLLLSNAELIAAAPNP